MVVREVPLATWLDGVVAGLGAATLTAAFVFETIVRSIGGSPAEVATNVAYPVGDLVLVALVVGTLTILPTWRNPQLLVLALGCALLAVGDTVYLFQSSAGTYQVGTLLRHLAGRHGAHVRRGLAALRSCGCRGGSPDVPIGRAHRRRRLRSGGALRGSPRSRRPACRHAGPPHVGGRDGALTALLPSLAPADQVPRTRGHDGRADGTGQPPVPDEHARQALCPRGDGSSRPVVDRSRSLQGDQRLVRPPGGDPSWPCSDRGCAMPSARRTPWSASAATSSASS